jgi:hypothetical protein
VQPLDVAAGMFICRDLVRKSSSPRCQTAALPAASANSLASDLPSPAQPVEVAAGMFICRDPSRSPSPRCQRA